MLSISNHLPRRCQVTRFVVSLVFPPPPNTTHPLLEPLLRPELQGRDGMAVGSRPPTGPRLYSPTSHQGGRLLIDLVPRQCPAVWQERGAGGEGSGDSGWDEEDQVRLRYSQMPWFDLELAYGFKHQVVVVVHMDCKGYSYTLQIEYHGACAGSDYERLLRLNKVR
jgi:hypothetical protein